jgi:hypothetical protein
MTGSEGDVYEYLGGRETSPAPAGLVDEEANLLVARAAKALLLGRFSDGAADLGRM